MVPRRFPHTALLSLLTLGSLVLASCDKVPLLAPAGTVITLVSTTNTLPINGTTDLVAVLIENGSTGTGANATPSSGTPVHNGTLVSFTTTLGKIEPSEARTNNGKVTVKMTADGRSGTATITAFSGGASQTLEVLIGAAAAERVLVSANPTSVPAVGGTVTVSARVEDASGNALPGVPVAFTTTAGTLGATSAVTGTTGVATTTLSTTAAATITATAGGKNSTAGVTVRTASTVSLTVPSGSQTVGAPVSFTVTPSANTTLSNVVVNFGDGNTANLGTITGATPVSNIFEDEGIQTVRVTGTDADGSPVNAVGTLAVVGFAITVTTSPASGIQTLVAGEGLVTFTVGALPTGVTLDSVDWDFGQPASANNTKSTNTLATNHKYTATGTYTVQITVYPTHGPSRSASIQVVIQ